MIGFGPTLWSRRSGETEYGVKAIPLGGYISMVGMFPPGEGRARRGAASTSFFHGLVQDARDSSTESITPGRRGPRLLPLPVRKRIIIMLGGPFMNLVLAVVLFAVLLMGFGVAQASTTRRLASRRARCPPPASDRRASAGDPAAAGAAAGIEPGDRIVSVDGTPIDSWDAVDGDHPRPPRRAVEFVVERDGAEVTLAVTPMLSERYATDEHGAVVTDAAGDPVTVQVGLRRHRRRRPRPCSSRSPPCCRPSARTSAGVAGIILNLPQRMVDVANAAFGPRSATRTGR